MSLSNSNLMMAFDCLKSDVTVKDAIASATVFAKKMGWEQKAITVISPQDLNWPSDFTKNWRDEFEKLGIDALSEFLKKNRLKENFPAKVLMQPYHSRRKSINAVLSEARRGNTGAIAVFTHTHRSGFALPGSFVSSLVHESSVPVLVLNTKAPSIQSVKTILVATDFSPSSVRTFNKSVLLAKRLGAQIILVHILPMLINATIAASSGMAGGWSNVEFFLDEEESRLRKKAKLWIDRAGKMGVEASSEIVSNAQSVAPAILKIAARRKADLIVTTEKIGPWASVLLGSVTRDILADAIQPVLVMPVKSPRTIN